MNAQELKERYSELYDLMSTSRKTENMKLFGKVMSDMMYSVIQRNPSDAEEWINELEAIEWKNYLTPKEAEKIVSEMEGAPWTRDVWNKAMDNYGLEKENKPCYNPCAMWVAMNQTYVCHAKTLAKIVGTPLDEIPTESIVEAIYLLTLDTMKGDKMGIRHKYGL